MNVQFPAYSVTFEPAALARCFLLADVFDACFREPRTEYGLLGLAFADDPYRVVLCPLLPGQHVTNGSVHQAGHDVALMRREVESLSQQAGRKLVPIAFVHRHPAGCGMSDIDRTFLESVFVEQVSTVVTHRATRLLKPSDLACDCLLRSHKGLDSRSDDKLVAAEIEYSVAFSLIVNRKREHSIHTVEKRWCPVCDRAQVSQVPAVLVRSTKRPLTRHERLRMLFELEAEIRAKVIHEEGQHVTSTRHASVHLAAGPHC